MRTMVVIAFTVAATACDWAQFALLNSMPIDADPDSNPVVHVFLGVDGLTYDVARDVIAAEGARDRVAVARMIAMFPATSDASWGRLLRTKRMGGYEFEYYDPVADKIENDGLSGLLKHGVPAFESFGLDKPPYYDAFDYYADGYFDTYFAYQEAELAFADAVDSVLFTLSSRAPFTPSFAAYLLEIDAMGHMQGHATMRHSFASLWRRLQRFKKHHPERRFIFTIFSDHGMDFQPAAPHELVDFASVLESLGVNAVSSFAQGRRDGGLFALPIIHTRVSYLSLHTEESMAPEIARRCSKSPTVDIAVSRVPAPAAWAHDAGVVWTALWRSGAPAVTYGYRDETDTYLLRAADDFAAFDVAPDFAGTAEREFSDEELFEATASARYPDLFFRARTSLEPMSVVHPGQVMISFARPYASLGFSAPGGANEIASEGFHGGLEAAGSVGVLITEAGDLPATVRSDSFGDLIPSFRAHMEARGVAQRDGDASAALDYATR